MSPTDLDGEGRYRAGSGRALVSGAEGYRAGIDGTVPGLLVVGFHGEVRPGETPAVAGPVLVDQISGRLVQVAMTGTDELLILGLRSRFQKGDLLPGFGTEIGPWPARLDDVVLVMGPDDMDLMPDVDRKATFGDRSFFRWAESRIARSEELRAERLSDGTVAWYCSKRIASLLKAALAGVLYDIMVGKLGKPSRELAALGWRLSRAATSDGTIALACAAVKRAGDPGWQVLLREGLRHEDPVDRDAYLREAERLLDEEEALDSDRRRR